ncbi:MAG: hypothetical protein GC152_13080 [Alphaproteobacteria bacterium]|nr:hypothetical protein [Alphaproteobacteria bacterium]
MAGACAASIANSAVAQQPTSQDSEAPAYDRNSLRDVQLGETDNLLRIAFICRDACPINQRADGVFVLAGVAADLELDLSSRSRHLSRLSLFAGAHGSEISLDLAADFDEPTARACEAHGEAAWCLDFARAEAAFADARSGGDQADEPARDRIALRQPPAEDHSTQLAAGEMRAADVMQDGTGDAAVRAASASFNPPAGLRDADATSPAPAFAPQGFRIDGGPRGPRPLEAPPPFIRAPIDVFGAGVAGKAEASLSLPVDAPILGSAVAPVIRTAERIGFSAPEAERFAPPIDRLDFVERPHETAMPPTGAPADPPANPRPAPPSAAPREDAGSTPAARASEPRRKSEALPETAAPAGDAAAISRSDADRIAATFAAADAAARMPAAFDLGGEAERILGRPLDADGCADARERLQSDAWALDAMVEIGFCRAAAGEIDAADKDFARLLAYTPDNYEALVGRALIAARKGDRSDAMDLFQEALNALPPIEESNRIVDAMTRL